MANNYITLKFPHDSNYSAFGRNNTLSKTERFVVFIAKDFTIQDKKNIDSTTTIRKLLCGISLYLPGNLSETYTQDWSLATPLSLQSVVNSALDKLKNSIVGGQLSSLLQSKSGKVLVPAQELMYNGPQPRTINFAYDLIPTSVDEYQTIKNIVSIFKRLQAPTKTSLAFLTTPAIWEIMITGIDDNENSDFLTWGFKDRNWALTSVELNGSPDGSFTAFHNGFPIKTTLSLTFNDIIPLYRDSDSETEIENILRANK